jgi:Haem-NO-binding
MHGLINRALQGFVIDTFGPDVWFRVVRDAELPFDGFEPMLTYDVIWTPRVIDAAARVLDRSRAAVLEDLGTHLVSHPKLEPIRRLLRFGGVTYRDFLDSLEDLPERAQMALPDLNMPQITLEECGPTEFRLRCRFKVAGVGHVMLGLLRAMADDYGALVLLDHHGATEEGELLSIRLLDDAHGVAREFDLALVGLPQPSAYLR